MRGGLAEDPSPDRPRRLRTDGRESVDVNMLEGGRSNGIMKKSETGDFSFRRKRGVCDKQALSRGFLVRTQHFLFLLHNASRLAIDGPRS